MLPLAAADVATASAAFVQEGKPPLTIASFAGAFSQAQMFANVQPYRDHTNHWVKDDDGSFDPVRARALLAHFRWEPVSMALPNTIEGCRAGLLESIDHDIWPPARDGTTAAEVRRADARRRGEHRRVYDFNPPNAE